MQSGERIVINGQDYRLGSILSTGAGSYGQVWAATDASGRAVALKFINTDIMSQADPALRGHWRAHLEREIVFLSSLNAAQSQHIVTLLDHGHVDDQPVLVLERLQANLGQWLAQQRRDNAPLPDLARTLDWAEQILDGLDVIHHAGFVYRDLKFSNILVGADGALLKLADFGSLRREDGDSTRSFMGTPATMAPEQILPVRQDGDSSEYVVDHRTDYYALGLLLFTLLTSQPATAAQRRLGQLLTLHGQEGASQHRDHLGGLTEEEQELLRRAIEFWTVPVLTDSAGGGTAAILTDLVTRLLACNPIDRPADSVEIRAVLDVMRTDQPSVPPMILAGDIPVPIAPPNRHPRPLQQTSRPLWLRRGIGLMGAFGLAGALAWGMIRVGGEFRQDPVALPDAVLAPPTPVVATPLAPPTPTPAESAPAPTDASAQSTPKEEPAALSPAPAPAPTVVAAPPNSVSPAAPEPPSLVEAPETNAVEPTTTESTTAESTTAESTTAESTTAESTAANTTTESTDDPLTTPPVDLQPAAASPKPVAPTATATPLTPGRSATPQPKPSRSKASIQAKSVAKATPSATEPAPPSRPPAPPPAAPLVAKPATKPDAPPAPPPAAKPTSKPAMSSASKVANRHSSRSSKTAVAPSRSSTLVPAVVHATPLPKAAMPSASTARPTIAPASPAAHAESPTRTTSRPRVDSPAALPPLELVSRSKTGKTSTSAATPTPPLELVSRSNRGTPPVSPAAPIPPAASPTPTVPPVSVAHAEPAPKQPAVTTRSRSSVKSSDPVTQFREDAGRATDSIRREAEAFTRWLNHTGTEVQRGLENADRTVKRWTGGCDQAHGCNNSNERVVRRDRWSRRYGGGAAQSGPNELPMPYAHDNAEAESSSRPAQSYR